MRFLPDAVRRRLRQATPEQSAAVTPQLPRSRDELLDYWRDPGASNPPESYVAPVVRSKFLESFIRPHVSNDARVLEIGCNVGRNLAYLLGAGYKNLTGVEVSAGALAAPRREYPNLAATARLINEPIEDVICGFGDRSFDLVFTMAVLEHIHPDSEWIFAEMVRVTDSTVVTVEDEVHSSWRHVPRDYRKVFEGLGMRQVAEQQMSKSEGLSAKFRARIFVRPE